MGLQDRITYNSGELIQLMENRLDKLGKYRFDSKYRELFGEVFVEKLSDWDRNIRSRKDDAFTIVVCGEFKRGKSSLINALLGEDVVTTNVTTETVTLNKISYGIHSNEALLSGGRRMRLSDEELKKDHLDELIRQADEPIQQLELKRPIELLKAVTIIDTPGLGDSLKDFSSLVAQALQQADAVIYVFSVSYPLSQNEQLFLKTEILPQKYTDVFLVGNYADILRNQDEYERMSGMLVQKTQGLLPGLEPWMLSALDEQCIRWGEERPNAAMEELLGTNFERFRETLNRKIEEKREMVLPDRMQRMIKGMKEDLEAVLSAMEDGLTMDSHGIQAAVERINDQCQQQLGLQSEASARINDRIKIMQGEAYQCISGLLDRMQTEVDTLEDMTSSDLTKYYSFYCIDTLQDAMNRCAEQHTAEVYEFLEEIAGELTQGFTNTQPGAYNFRFTLDNRTWTRGDNVGYVVNKVNMGALGLIADGIAGAMRQKEMKTKTPDILQKIKEQYTGLRVSCLKTVEELYSRMLENAKKQLDEYYGEKICAAKQQVEQSAMVARQDEEKKAALREEIGKFRVLLGELEL